MGVRDPIFPEEIKKNLGTKVFGREIYYFEDIDSTNRIAKELANDGGKEGIVVISETQSSGRGRLDRKWVSPHGGLWFSFILRPQITPKKAPLLTLLTGVACAKTIRMYGLDAKIKWPNDVLINKKKVCGILTEMGMGTGARFDVINYIVVGVGINANVDCTLFPEDLKEQTTSLKDELKTDISRIDLMQSFLMLVEHFYESFKNQNFDYVISEWKSLSDTLGSHVVITTPNGVVEGKAIDINSDGALILKLSDKSEKTIFSGDCTHVNNK